MSELLFSGGHTRYLLSISFHSLLHGEIGDEEAKSLSRALRRMSNLLVLK